jgi:hypothetical protein
MLNMRRFWDNCPRWLLWSVPFILTFALYGRILSLPLYWDDAPHFYFTVPLTLSQIWTNDTGYAYYRPLIFTFYKLAFGAFVPDFIFLCYGTSLAIHALNGVLVGILASVLVRGVQGTSGTQRALPLSPTLAGVLASLLFVMYPFAVYAVGNFAALMHPVVVCLTLIGLLALCRFLRAPARRWLLVILLATALAPFFHESGVMVSAIVVWAMLCLNGRMLRRYWWMPIALFLLSGMFVVIWWIVPKSRGGGGWPDLKMVFDNVTFFLQGLTFPVQPLATLLIDRFKWNDIAAIWLVGLPLLLGFAVLFRYARQGRLYLLVVGWAILAVIPSIFALQFWYIVTGPRLLYCVAPPTVLLWTLGCMTAIRYMHRTWTRVLVGVGVALLVVATPLYFIEHKVQLYELSLAPIKQLAYWARTYPRDRHIVINSPAWVADIKDLYPLGRWGVSIMPDYVQLIHLLRTNTGLTTTFANIYFPPVQEVMDSHNYEISGPGFDWSTLAAHIPGYDHVWLTTYSDKRIAIEEAGTIKTGTVAAPEDYHASFDEQVFLLNGHYAVEGQEALVTLNWKYLGPNPNATVFRHVFDCAGNVLGMGDGYVLDRTVQFSDLAPGAEIRDVRRIPLKALSADGCYYVEVGLFREDGTRLKAVAPDGTAFENAVVTIRQQAGNE